MRELRQIWIRGAYAALILIFAGVASACHSGGASVTVSVSPSTTNLALSGTTTFFATVTNATDTTVTWQVNGVTGGNSTCGTITTNGLYTAPSVLPTTGCAGPTTTSTPCNTLVSGTITATSGCVLITAVSNQNSKAMAYAAVTLVSGVTITVTPTGTATMATGESLSFVATVSGTTNLTVNWLVNGVQGGTMDTGFINSTTIGNGEQANAAIYTAPTTVPSPNPVSIEAQSAADNTQEQTISVTVSLATPPVLNSIAPLLIPQGAVLEDLYLSGSGFLSTTNVLFSGVSLNNLTGGGVTAVNATVLRARVPFNLLENAGTYTVSAQEQIPMPGQPVQSIQVQVVPVRPSLVGATPITILQNSPTTTVELAGGYYTPGTLSEWNGHLVSSTADANFPRTLQATIKSTDLTEAGLFPIAVRTPGDTIVSISRVGGTVTANLASVLTVPGGNGSGLIAVSGVTDSSFDGTFVVLTGSGTSMLTWTQAGANASSAGGSVSVGPAPLRSAINVSIRPPGGPTAPNTTVSGFMKPVAVAIDDITGVAAVVDQAKNQLDLLSPGFTGIAAQIPVGTTPTSVGIDGVRNLALVTDSGSNDLDVVDLTAVNPTITLPCLGTAPVAVGVDELHGRALVVDQNGSAAFILSTTQPMTCPTVPPGLQPITSISRNNGVVTATLVAALTIPGGNGVGTVVITGVADSSYDGTFVVTGGSGTNTLTWSQAGPNSSSGGGSASTGGGSVLATVAVSTGTQPQITVVPELGWAIVTPGGAGALSVVDLTRLSLVFSATVTVTTRGVAVNTETKTMILADPSSASGLLFSLLDQSISSVPLTLGNVAAAANPFTNEGIMLNPGSHLGYLLDLNTPTEITTIALGSDPIAVALDAATDLALVVDDVDATVTVVNLGATRSTNSEPQILEMTPTYTLTSTTALPVLIAGAGFTAASQIRVNETPIPTTFVNSRELTGSIPPSFLMPPYAPVRIVVDVVNSPTLFSNVRNLLVALPVPVGNSPQGVAVDQDNDRVLVANSGDNTVSVIDISPVSPTFGTVTSLLTVGTTPLAVGMVSRNGMAVATNSGADTASIIDLTTNPYTVPSTVSLGSYPTGVGISESLGDALITNSDSNSISQFALTPATTTVPSGVAVDEGPIAAAVAPDLNYAVVAETTANNATLLDVSSGTPVFLDNIANVSGASGVDYDPVTQQFLIQASESNTVVELLATCSSGTCTLVQTSIRVGVDPTSLAYNFQNGELLTLNSGSSTLSVVDFPAQLVRDVLPLSAGTVYAMAIHRRLEYVVVSDSANNQVLLLPLPR